MKKKNKVRALYEAMKKLNASQNGAANGGDSLGWDQNPQELLKVIKSVVAEKYGIKEADFESENRAKAVAFPRQIAIHLACDLTLLSLPEIVEAFGKKYSTVMDARNKMREYLRTDICFAPLIEQLVSEIQAAVYKKNDNVRENAGKI